MPTRIPQHSLEDQSRAAFAALVQPWVFRDKKPDYGIDGEVEVFDQGKATGELFLVQLKATESLAGRPGHSFDIEWIRYYWSLDLPVLIGLWVKDSNKMFWTWAAEIDLFYAKPRAKSYTVQLTYEWNAQTHRTIQKHLALRRGLRLEQLPSPLRLAVDGAADRIASLSTQLQNLFSSAPQLLRYSDTDADVTATLLGDELKVFFRGQRGVVFHSMDNVDLEGAAQRIVIGTVITLADLGALNKAGELWSSFPPLVSGVSSVDVAWRVVSILARSGAHAELLTLIRALRPRLGAVVAAPLLPLYFTAPKHRKKELGRLLTELERDDLQNPSPEARSIALYNLAKFADDPRTALRHFARAIKESRFYDDKSYFWAELGALLFSHGRYRAALSCYRHAHVKLKHTSNKSHYADALMHTGAYAEALHAFPAIARDVKGALLTPDQADALIKRTVLAPIVEEFGISTQRRQRRLAADSMGDLRSERVTDLEMLARTKIAIEHDALYNTAWFNRARALRRLNRESEALLSYLTAAAVVTSDDESWLNAIMLAGRHDQRLLQNLLVYVPHIRGNEFVRYITERAQREANDRGRQLLTNMAQLFAENLLDPEDGTIRVHGSKPERSLILRVSENAIRIHRENTATKLSAPRSIQRRGHSKRNKGKRKK